MKRQLKFLLSTIILFGLLSSSIPNGYPIVENNAFKIGEKLRYRISYGIIDAGEAVLEVKSTSKKGNGRELIHAVATGRSLGAFNSVFKVDDTYETFLDKKSMFPWYFVRRVDEGGYKIKQDYTFKHDIKKVYNGKGKSFKIPMGTQDMISSFYYARTLDYKCIKKGNVYDFPCFMDDELFTLKIKYVGDEIIHTRLGKFKCYKFVPVVQTGRLFKNEEDVNFWVTKDANKIPILVKAKIPVGYIKMHLVEWSGLKSSASSRVK